MVPCFCHVSNFYCVINSLTDSLGGTKQWHSVVPYYLDPFYKDSLFKRKLLFTLKFSVKRQEEFEVLKICPFPSSLSTSVHYLFMFYHRWCLLSLWMCTPIQTSSVHLDPFQLPSSLMYIVLTLDNQWATFNLLLRALGKNLSIIW